MTTIDFQAMLDRIEQLEVAMEELKNRGYFNSAIGSEGCKYVEEIKRKVRRNESR